MKTILLFSILFLGGYIYPQQTLFSNNSSTEAVKLDSRGEQIDFVPGIILVKLKDDAFVGLSKKNGLSVTGISSVDVVLNKYKVSSVEQLFPNAERSLQKKIFKSYNGHIFEQPNLHNIYKLKIASEQELFPAIEELKQNQNVVYAEPNYIL